MHLLRKVMTVEHVEKYVQWQLAGKGERAKPVRWCLQILYLCTSSGVGRTRNSALAISQRESGIVEESRKNIYRHVAERQPRSGILVVLV